MRYVAVVSWEGSAAKLCLHTKINVMPLPASAGEKVTTSLEPGLYEGQGLLPLRGVEHKAVLTAKFSMLNVRNRGS